MLIDCELYKSVKLGYTGRQRIYALVRIFPKGSFSEDHLKDIFTGSDIRKLISYAVFEGVKKYMEWKVSVYFKELILKPTLRCS